MAQVHARLAEIPRGERVYVMCASGNLSYTAAGRLRNAGIDARLRSRRHRRLGRRTSPAGPQH